MTITEAVLEVLAEFVQRGYTAQSINDGQCDRFAYRVVKRIPDAHELWDDDLQPPGLFDGIGSHCFVEYEEKYYDSECPDGVDDWKELPFFVRAIGNGGLPRVRVSFS